jgi:hypothetical protein
LGRNSNGQAAGEEEARVVEAEVLSVSLAWESEEEKGRAVRLT